MVKVRFRVQGLGLGCSLGLGQGLGVSVSISISFRVRVRVRGQGLGFRFYCLEFRFQVLGQGLGFRGYMLVVRFQDYGQGQCLVRVSVQYLWFGDQGQRLVFRSRVKVYGYSQDLVSDLGFRVQRFGLVFVLLRMVLMYISAMVWVRDRIQGQD